jgi:hypothetical protein
MFLIYSMNNCPSMSFYLHRGRTEQMKQDYPLLKRDDPLNECTFGMRANEKNSPNVEKNALTRDPGEQRWC